MQIYPTSGTAGQPRREEGIALNKFHRRAHRRISQIGTRGKSVRRALTDEVLLMHRQRKEPKYCMNPDRTIALKPVSANPGMPDARVKADIWETLTVILVVIV